MKRIMAMMFGVLLCIGMTAAAGDGVPDAYLTMESSSVEDGAKEVPVVVEIFMKFSNNVVNLKVNENNLTCFTLLDSEGNEVAIEVIMGDDQVDRTIKNDITIKPVEVLKENENYQLIVSKDLMSKNGNNMQEDVVIGFQTINTEPEDIGSGRSMAYMALGAVIAAVILRGRHWIKRRNEEAEK